MDQTKPELMLRSLETTQFWYPQPSDKDKMTLYFNFLQVGTLTDISLEVWAVYKARFKSQSLKSSSRHKDITRQSTMERNHIRMPQRTSFTPYLQKLWHFIGDFTSALCSFFHAIAFNLFIEYLQRARPCWGSGVIKLQAWRPSPAQRLWSSIKFVGT